MSAKPNSASLLNMALAADAIASGATGIMLFSGASFLTGLLGLPEMEMRYVGTFLLVYAVFVAFVARFKIHLAAAVWVIIVANAIWVVDSVLLLFTGWISPTGLGVAFVIAQAIVVAVLAGAQVIGLRRNLASAPFPSSHQSA